MINEVRKAALKKLIEESQVYVPDQKNETEIKAIVLKDDHPDTLAIAFEEWSIEKCNIKHRWHPSDGWTIFKDCKYQTVDAERQIGKYLSGFLKNCWFKKGKTKQRIKLSGNKIRDILQQLSYLDSVYLMPKQIAPCSLSDKLDRNHVIALNNGLLNWGVYPYDLMPNSEDYYTLNYLPYNWDGEKDSELWVNFLVDACGGDEELHDLLQQWAGYCLMLHNMKEQRFMIINGEADTGKSVFIDVMTNLLGRNNVSACPLEKFDDPHFITMTYGKMLNVTDESESKLEESIEVHLKHYTGGTVFTFKRLYHEPFTAYPTAKIMITTNQLPAFKDTSNGVWRRILIAPFDNVVSENKKDKKLVEKILATEMPGVLKWALDGARKIEKYGFIVPEVCKEKLEKYRRESVPEIAFFDENFEVCDKDFGTRCDAVRACYEQWCKGQGCGIKSNKKLNKTLKKLFPLYERKRGRDGLNLTYLYFGIKIREDSEFYSEVAY